MLPLYFRYDAYPPPPGSTLKNPLCFRMESAVPSFILFIENDSVTFMFTINEGDYSSVEQQLAGGFEGDLMTDIVCITRVFPSGGHTPGNVLPPFFEGGLFLLPPPLLGCSLPATHREVTFHF